MLVVDDEEAILLALQRGLEQEGYRVLLARGGTEALDLMATAHPDLLVLDLGLPDTSGVDVIKRLRGWSEVPIVVVSGHGSDQDKIVALDVGADDFVTKPFNLDELRARVRAVLRRTRDLTIESELTFGDLVVDRTRRLVRKGDEPVHLTPTEYTLLEALASRPGKLLTHAWLLDRVWGRGFGDESRQTLRVHVGQLRAKIGDSANDPSYIKTETGVGYRWLPEAD